MPPPHPCHYTKSGLISRARSGHNGCGVFGPLSASRYVIMPQPTTVPEPSHAVLKGVLTSAIDGIIVLKALRDEAGSIHDFEILVMNPAAERITGQDHRGAVGKTLLGLWPGNVEEGLFDAYKRVTETGEPYDAEKHYPHDGLDHWLRIAAVQVDDGFAVTFSDINRAKRAEAELSRNQRLLQAVYDQSRGFIGTLALDGTLLDANQVAFAAIGEQREGVIGAPFWETPWWSPDPEVQATIRQAVMRAAAGVPFHRQLPYFLGDGTRRLLDFSLTPLRDEDGQVVLIVPQGRDVTERVEAERALHREQEFLKALLESLQEGIVACDAEGHLTLFNQATKGFHGLPHEPLPASAWADHYDLFQPDGRTPMAMADVPLFRALAGEVVRDVEMIIAPKGREPLTLRASGQAIFDAQGAKLGAVVAMHDVTARRRAEDERDRMFDLSIDMLAVAGLDGYFKRLNPAFERTLGWTAAELMASPFIEWVHPDDVAATLAEVEKLAGGAVALDFENRYRCKDGSYRWLSWRAKPVGGLLYCVTRDVTGRRLLEEEQARRARHALLRADVAAALAAEASLQQSLEACAQAVAGWLGGTFAGIWLLDAPGGELVPQASAGLHPHPDGAQARAPLEIGRIAAARQPHLTNDLPNDPRIAAPAWARREGMVAFAGYPLLAGGTLVGVFAVFARQPLPDDALDALALVADAIAQSVDRTRARLALARHNDELQALDRMKDEFLSALSAQLGTPINTILGYLDVLADGGLGPLTGHQETYLRRLRANAGLLLALVNDQLDLSRLSGGKFVLDRQPTELAATAHRVVAMLSPLLEQAGQRLVDVLPARLPETMVDEARIEQVLTQLIYSATKLTPPAGLVRVAAEVQGPVLRFEVQDSGRVLGEAAERIFDRYTRHGGSWLGLAVTRALVEAHGGQIGVEGLEGSGNRYWFTLPLALPEEERP